MNTGRVDTLRRMSPNKPKTPVSGFRIPLDLKVRASERASREGRTLTDVVVEALQRYADGK